MTKQELRKKYKSLRSVLSLSEIDDRSLAIANQVLSMNIWQYSFYHVFLSIEAQKEINTDYVLNILSGKDKNIVLGKSNFEDYSMKHFLLTDGTIIKKNDYGIPEPQDGIPILPTQLDAVFVPLLAFDTMGNRIGYGNGFYDTFLAECKLETLKIGLSFFEAETEPFETFESDVRLDICVTPNQVYHF